MCFYCFLGAENFVTNITTRKGLSNNFTVLLTVLCYSCPATCKPCANVSSISEGNKCEVVKEDA
jgi:hypothetical protein